MATPNCANEAAGMASIRSVSNSKRIVRILNHLARSSFDCPVGLCGCGLRGVRGDASSVIDKNRTDALSGLSTTAQFWKMHPKEKWREPRDKDSRRRKLSLFAPGAIASR